MQQQLSSSDNAQQGSTAVATDTIGTLEASATASQIRVIHGVNDDYYEIGGKTIGEVRKVLRNILNLPGDSQALIGGVSVGDEYILKAGETLEFFKAAGVKG